MLLVKTYVAPSPIHGLGLFAADPIPAGKVWWRFDHAVDRCFLAKSIALLPPEFRAHLERYGFFNDGSWTLCGDLAIFVNHSDSPPSRHDDNLSTACRNIASGEEITERYSDFNTPDAGSQK